MVHTFLNGPFGENCYIYSDENTKNALVVDPGYEMEKLLDLLKPYTLTHIFITHAHIDHIAGLEELKKTFPDALICGHELTKESLPNPDKNLSYRWGEPIIAPAPDWTYGGEKGALKACGQDWECIFTPGHAYDHTAFLASDGTLFGGDVIFEGGGCGRYDLPGSDFEALKKSLFTLLKLDSKTQVYPGHGGSFSIEEAVPYFQ